MGDRVDLIIDAINFVIAAVGGAIGWVFGFLPDSPVKDFGSHNPPNSLVVLGYINFFIPFPRMILHFTLILSCIAIYYVYRVILRWLKVVRS